MNITAKTAALLLSGILLLLGLIDFVNRLTFSASVPESTSPHQQAVVADGTHAGQLTPAAMAKLLDWSDIAPVVVKKTRQKPKIKPVAAPVKVARPVDVHRQVRQAIEGDVSKHLLGDDLLSLKGIFYDGNTFAAVEIENINSKKSRYITFAANKTVDQYKLIEIGKNHVILQKLDDTIKLQLFER